MRSARAIGAIDAIHASRAAGTTLAPRALVIAARAPRLASTCLLAAATALAACGANDGGAIATGDAQPASAATLDAGDGDSGGSNDAPTEAGLDDAATAGGLDGCTTRATADLNLRAGPSTSDSVLEVIPSGDPVTILSAAATNGFYRVSHSTLTGWAFGQYLDLGSCAAPSAPGVATLASLEALAASSDCAGYAWKDRGVAPKGYVEGVADTFARAVCEPTRSDVLVVSRARTSDEVHDALAWYDSIFSSLGMSNDAAGVDTLRHAYVLLLGLGMRESSGEHCCGRDMSATNVSSDSAEAGAWQTSWDSHSFSGELPALFARYRTSDVGCLLGTFERGVSCSATDWQDWGSGDGYDFQKREKECPSFAAEYAAVMLRVDGGSLGHYGPLRRQDAEVRPECDAMLQHVQALVTAHPELCAAL